jgi:hypothetical protein
MRATFASAFLALLASLAAGCTRRVMVQPHYVSDKTEYVYFVEQVNMRDSLIKKCDIAPDNTASCTTQYKQ